MHVKWMCSMKETNNQQNQKLQSVTKYLRRTLVSTNSDSTNKIFILAGALDTRLSFYEV